LIKIKADCSPDNYQIPASFTGTGLGEINLNYIY